MYRLKWIVRRDIYLQRIHRMMGSNPYCVTDSWLWSSSGLMLIHSSYCEQPELQHKAWGMDKATARASKIQELDFTMLTNIAANDYGWEFLQHFPSVTKDAESTKNIPVFLRESSHLYLRSPFSRFCIFKVIFCEVFTEQHLMHYIVTFPKFMLKGPWNFLWGH